MGPNRRWLLVAFIVLLAAGCLGATEDAPTAASSSDEGDADPYVNANATVDHGAIAEAVGEPITVHHDHTDASLHDQSLNAEVVSWSTLGVELGTNGFADFVFHPKEDMVAVAVDGDEEGGFKLVDVNDPEDPEVVGTYWIQGNSIQEVEFTPNGRYVLVNVQDVPAPGPEAQDCQVCIHVVDVTDPAQPERVDLFPVHLVGTHNIEAFADGGDTWVYYTGQPLAGMGSPVGAGSNPPPGNEVGLAVLEEGPDGAHLAKVGSYRHADSYVEGGASFPHDVHVEEHALTGDRLVWAAWWDGGALTIDASEPAAPRTLDVNQERAPSDALAIHQFTPEPEPRDGTLYAWSAPEIGSLETGSGLVRAYDVTDPTSVEQVGTWSLPGDVTIPGRYLVSPHTVDVDPDTQVAAVTHYHAGVWFLDVTDPSDPRTLGFIQPVGEDEPYTGPYWWKKPNFSPDGYVPNAFQAKWQDGLLYVTMRGTGLYVLDYTGPRPADAPAGGAS
jgi:hypothetical protein